MRFLLSIPRRSPEEVTAKVVELDHCPVLNGTLIASLHARRHLRQFPVNYKEHARRAASSAPINAGPHSDIVKCATVPHLRMIMSSRACMCYLTFHAYKGDETVECRLLAGLEILVKRLSRTLDVPESTMLCGSRTGASIGRRLQLNNHSSNASATVAKEASHNTGEKLLAPTKNRRFRSATYTVYIYTTFNN